MGAAEPLVPAVPLIAAGPLPASPGIAVGPAWVPSTDPYDAALGDALDSVDDRAGDAAPDPALDQAPDPGAQEARLLAALADAEKDVRRAREHTAAVAGEREAAVFDAHVLLLDDPDLLAPALAAIAAGRGALAAWRDAVAGIAAALDRLPDPYQRARADDVRAVGSQVEAHLRGVRAPSIEVPPDSVLVARDLTPAQAATLDPTRVAAVVLAAGSPTAHSAILVRALGIPAVVGAGAGVLAVTPGTVVAVDGTRGEVVVDPSPDVRVTYQERAVVLARRRKAARASSAAPAMTRDGVEIHVGANLASLEDARAAAGTGADLAGLVRPSCCSSTAQSRRRSTSRRTHTARWPTRSPAGGSSSELSTSAVTSPCRICRCPPRRTRSSASAGSGCPCAAPSSCWTSSAPSCGSRRSDRST